MIAAIVWQNKSEKAWARVKILCLDFWKTPSNQNIKSNKVATFEICEFFLTTISHTYGTIKPPWRAAIIVVQNIGLHYYYKNLTFASYKKHSKINHFNCFPLLQSDNELYLSQTFRIRSMRRLDKKIYKTFLKIF